MFDQEQRALLERETIDFTVRVPVRDLIDLVVDEAFAPKGEYSMQEVGPVDVWSYMGPAAALTALKDHGWMFMESHVGRKWVEAALIQSDDAKFERPIEDSLHEARRKIAERDGSADTAQPQMSISVESDRDAA